MTFGFTDNPKITLIKIIAIVYIILLFSITCVLISIVSDKYILNTFNDNDIEKTKKKSTLQLFSEITLIFIYCNILAYFIRNILHKVPFPLDGVYNFDYYKVKEITSGSLVFGFILLYSNILYRKIQIFRTRLLSITS